MGIASDNSNPSFGGPFNNIELIVARQPETYLGEKSEKQEGGNNSDV